MNQEQEKLMIEGIKLLIEIETTPFHIRQSKSWLNKYERLFPKQEPFGGPIINEEDD